MKTYLYRASNLMSTITFSYLQFNGRSQFLATTKNYRFLRFIHGNYKNNETLGRARELRTKGAWLNKLTE